ncbi:MAG: twin-arginine translocase TatA/TatE family subunit [Bacteroidota bacterium]|jgi:sec-independent protein translocase protein TatA|nr:twin-arginine translocase TatA/TatE family subunit [Ignavibacteria bacterium]MCU7498735.1 twin-arginine translocase TatA/TatE family subunit [Ignavibacteria bacterium]MCU7512070.1 twin-arginine translocase TatA/TatE family subunit [Ignavibacteria bacterium]MCU7520603.1 twin-arginine translocase TatA/TatE family subunit [Ignavibacteria bacterium]MCU7523501.1 twin-arginine translocase TatA/TatE family subunit [Ignavibacteria bacterium]
MFGNLGAGEIILIVLVILIFFGPKKIPEIAQGIGKGMREFKKAMRDVEDGLKNDTAPAPAKTLEPKSEGVQIPAIQKEQTKAPEEK